MKSIFSKLIIIYISILLISSIITGAMLYIFLGSFATQEKVNLLNEYAKKINNFVTIYIENQANPAAEKLSIDIINFYSSSANAIIWVANKDGYIVMMSEKGLSRSSLNIKNKLRTQSGKLRLPDKRQYNKVMAGLSDKYDKIQEQGDFYGLFKDTKVLWLTIERPFRYNETIEGAVYLSTPIPEVNKARATVFKFFIASMLISILISIVLVYIFSLRLSNPLKKIITAAKKISRGEFDEKLSITSNDEIGELAKTFNKMALELSEIDKMRSSFIANVSHELRTPMTSIKGFVDGIIDGTIPEEKYKEYLQIVSDEVKRLSRLVNDLLDLARMESGELKLNFRSFNINELIRRCIIKLENIIIKKDINIEADFEEEDIFVIADQDAIERVIINLTHNAIKFTESKGKIIFKTVSEDNFTVISIEDNGVGIKSEELELIWQRFYKSDKSRSKIGTGLGLSIVKNIIDEHKQKIWVESKIGIGTKFSFTLESSCDKSENF